VRNGLEQAYAITSYDSAELTYGIDELSGALFPRLSCDWPCGNCHERVFKTKSNTTMDVYALYK